MWGKLVPDAILFIKQIIIKFALSNDFGAIPKSLSPFNLFSTKADL